MGQEQSSERKKECAALACTWSGLVPFSRKLQAHQVGRKYIFYANLQPAPADEIYQDFENPEHGKLWSGGKRPRHLNIVLPVSISGTLENLVRLQRYRKS